MSKSKKQKQAELKAQQEARQITPAKLLRLALKSMGFAIVVAVVVIGLNLLGVPALGNTWVQLGIMFVVYLVAYPFLMSEFRPRVNKK
ncbi:MAG: hypothetical protein KC422_15650 [Trueperaceae bacterium]|nr:hypothetical protein [Trueperaceae bacterium]